jgi:hypothetical protein
MIEEATMISIQTVISEDIAPQGSVVEISFDQEGLETLMQILSILSGKNSHHAHLFSDAWGGDGQGDLGEISRKPGFATCHQLNMIKI